MSIAICLCTRNRPDELRGALQSVMQSHVVPSQIIVSDDSRDAEAIHTRAVADSFAGVVYGRGPRRGLSANRNASLRLLDARIDAVLFMDDDARLADDFLSKVFTEPWDEKLIVTGAELRDGDSIAPGNLSFWGHQEKMPRGPADVHAINITATVFPAGLFARVSFDEGLIYGSDEADICAQAEALGYRIVYRADALVVHTRSPHGRAEYATAAEVSRLYSTHRRYRWLENRPLRASLFRMLAPVHLLASRGVLANRARSAQAWQSIRRAEALTREETIRRRSRVVDAPQGARKRHQPVRTSVLIPSYGRPADLRLCLESVCSQQRQPDEVVVAIRRGDAATLSVAKEFSGLLPMVVTVVDRPGQVAALNAALQASSGEVVAITDDDASPRPDWLARIEAHFLRDAALGGVGGRDAVVGNTERPVDSSRVGRIQWFGRIVGNHHLGVGPARYVDVLKGANMSFDRRAINGFRFDVSLRGSGAQVHNDLGMCLAIRRTGWPLVYDPAVLVDHRVGARVSGDQRGFRAGPDAFDPAFNETVLLLREMGAAQSVVYLAWGLALGTKAVPGALQMARRSRPSLPRLAAAMQGRLAGAAFHLDARRHAAGGRNAERAA